MDISLEIEIETKRIENISNIISQFLKENLENGFKLKRLEINIENYELWKKKHNGKEISKTLMTKSLKKIDKNIRPYKTDSSGKNRHFKGITFNGKIKKSNKSFKDLLETFEN